MTLLAIKIKLSLNANGFFLDKNLGIDKYDIIIIDEASQMDIPETLFALHFADRCVMIGDHLQIPPFLFKMKFSWNIIHIWIFKLGKSYKEAYLKCS